MESKKFFPWLTYVWNNIRTVLSLSQFLVRFDCSFRILKGCVSQFSRWCNCGSNHMAHCWIWKSWRSLPMILLPSWCFLASTTRGLGRSVSRWLSVFFKRVWKCTNYTGPSTFYTHTHFFKDTSPTVIGFIELLECNSIYILIFQLGMKMACLVLWL